MSENATIFIVVNFFKLTWLQLERLQLAPFTIRSSLPLRGLNDDQSRFFTRGGINFVENLAFTSCRNGCRGSILPLHGLAKFAQSRFPFTQLRYRCRFQFRANRVSFRSLLRSGCSDGCVGFFLVLIPLIRTVIQRLILDRKGRNVTLFGSVADIFSRIGSENRGPKVLAMGIATFIGVGSHTVARNLQETVVSTELRLIFDAVTNDGK